MQHGPETPSSTPPQTDRQTDGQADEPVQNPQEQVLSSTEGQIEQESGSESFFETLTKGQDRPLGSTMLFSAGVILAFIVIMRSVMKSSAKRKQQSRTMGNTSERIESLKNRAMGSMDPARQAMVDAENLTRRMGAVLDNKAARIEILLTEATERIAELEHANRDQQRSEDQIPTPLNESRGINPEALDRARLDQDRVERIESGEHTYKFDPDTRGSPLPESPNPLTFSEQVEELITRGLDAKSIASTLGCPIGEVELVLNLRRNSG